MILTTKIIAASVLCCSLLCLPPAFAQTAGNGVPAASPSMDPGKNITSPSTMGGSVGTSANGRPPRRPSPDQQPAIPPLTMEARPAGGCRRIKTPTRQSNRGRLRVLKISEPFILQLWRDVSGSVAKVVTHTSIGELRRKQTERHRRAKPLLRCWYDHHHLQEPSTPALSAVSLHGLGSRIYGFGRSS